MNNLETVMSKLLEFRRKDRELETAAKQETDQYNSECLAVRDKAEESTAELKKSRQRVSTYADMAAMYTSSRPSVSGEEGLDIRALSVLSLKINRRSHDDPAAAAMLRSARRQINYIDRRLNEAEETLNKMLSDCAVLYKSGINMIAQKRADLELDFEAFLRSDALASVCAQSSRAVETFSFCQKTESVDSAFALGMHNVPSMLKEDWAKRISLAAPNLFEGGNILVPAFVNVKCGNVLRIDYTTALEKQMLDGVHALMLNIIRYSGSRLTDVEYIDPIRCDNSALGPLEQLAKVQDSMISPVPSNSDGVKNRLGAILESSRNIDVSSDLPSKVLYLHGFPENYDAQSISVIRQMALNPRYGVYIIFSHNIEARIPDGSLSVFDECAQHIYAENGFSKQLGNAKRMMPFRWFTPPEKLPADIVSAACRKNSVLGNNFTERVGISQRFTDKGDRRIGRIPYGVDEKGVVQYLDFEDSNFATFLSGASRSGKSTLLHTIITGLIQNNHPDDIEIWLVDFKMTEFSRYVEHTPPHVRYILLDESPELVYDLLDRLSEVLAKRQNIFKGKWQKLDDVPPERYMPAMFIIIDEFSVMSQIVADSAVNGTEDYRVKLQLLLAKGAALGMHFIFSSQGFTSGSRGLTDFSKKQIQQRISMKTEYSEIKETLDLKSLSDSDRLLMEELNVHHTLLRVPEDRNGNHLLKSKVLYIPDYTVQEQMIDEMCRDLSPIGQYIPDDPSVYVNKQTLIVDGSVYHSYDECENAIEKCYARQCSAEPDTLSVFPGEPRRMMDAYPVSLSHSFGENILMVAPPSENMPACSVILSLCRSLSMQYTDISVWSGAPGSVSRILSSTSDGRKLRTVFGLDGICQSIREIKADPASATEKNRCIIIFGADSLMQSMSLLQADSSVNRIPSLPKIERRAPGQPGLLAQLDALAAGKPVSHTAAEAPGSVSVQKEKTTGAYNAWEDLKNIIRSGPIRGVHFILVFQHAAEFTQTKLDLAYFRHKILFVMSKSDAMILAGGANASAVCELSSHSFRYTNGVDAVSFRPYLHPGLSWDGWQIAGGSAASMSDGDELLL